MVGDNAHSSDPSLHASNRYLASQQRWQRVSSSSSRSYGGVSSTSRGVSSPSRQLLTMNSVGSGYLFPSTDSPQYTKGSAVILALSVAGAAFTGLYQFLIWRENRKRDEREGGPPAFDCMPDTTTYADDAPGFRYMR